MPDRDFVHLHNHSTYSFGDGISQISHMAERAKEMGMHALALTDHGYGHGLLEFHRSCTKNGIKPILGCEIYFTPKGRLVRTEDNRRSNHLVLLAKNAIGYKNLIAILSAAAIEGFYYKPRADWELLQQHSEGLICLTACLAGPVAVHMYNNRSGSAIIDLAKARSALGQLKEIFGDDLFLEIQYHGMKPQDGHQVDYQSQLIKSAFPLSRSCEVPLIVTNDAHYVEPKQWRLRDLMMADACGQTVNDPLREIKDTEHQYYLKTVDQMWGVFESYDPQILLNTIEVARRVEQFDPGLEVGHRLPTFAGSSADSFARMVMEGFAIRYPQATKNSTETRRLEHELKTIETLGFRDYFLIVKDFIDYAENRDIPIGPGRGSAAGSIIAYSLGITTLDPIEHNLLFERFLNPSRVSLPDIDVDVCKERRGEVIDYLLERYGKENVAQIITFNRLKGRGSVRTVGRAMEIDQEIQNELSSVLPRDAGEFSVSLREVVNGEENAPKQAVQKIRSFVAQSQACADYIQAAVDLEGTYKSSGTHAAAVVIGPEPLKNILPLKLVNSEGAITTQFSMDDVEALGLLKMDLLGLDTLTVVSNALHMIMNNDPSGPLHGKRDIYTLRDLQREIPGLDDEKVYNDVFKDGRTIGIFQCDSAGLRELLARIGCSSFSDISAALALYRPGPLDAGMVDSFVKRRRGKEQEKLWHEELKPYLEETHGLPIYQEQIMFASQILCGFDMSEADNLRKVIGKKKKDAIAEFRTRFVSAAVKTGKISEARANEIYNDIELFGRYAFNLCLTEDTEVVTSRGVVPIKDVKSNDQVFTYDTSSGKVVPSNVVNNHMNGEKESFEYTFDDGSSVVCTKTHRFLSGNDLQMRAIDEVYTSRMYLWGEAMQQALPVKTQKNLQEVSKDAKEEKTRDWIKESSYSPGCSREVEDRKPREVETTEDRCLTQSSKVSNGKSRSKREHEGSLAGSSYQRNDQRNYKPDSEKNFSTSRDLRSKSRSLEEMERRESREVCRDNEEVDIFPKEIKTRTGNEAYSRKAWLYTSSQKILRQDKEDSRLPTRRREDHHRNRWTIPFLYHTWPGSSKKNDRKRQAVRLRGSSHRMETSKDLNKRIRKRWNPKETCLRDHRDGQTNEVRTLLPRRVVSRRRVGVINTHDLEVDHPDHNFILSNGLVTSNSHSASYAIITYYTGWLKTYYPEYFVAALLNKFVAAEIATVGATKHTKRNDDELFRTYLMEAQALGVRILPPNIATSYPDFRPVAPKTVSFGLGSLKNVGTAINSLIDRRDREGTFRTFTDFVKACIDEGVNKKVALRFVEAGCIDFGIAKAELVRLIEGYQRPKKNGEGVTKTTKSIFDDVRDLIKKKNFESKKFKEKMTDEERAVDTERRQAIYDSGIALLGQGLRKASAREAGVIDPPGVYRIKKEVHICH